MADSSIQRWPWLLMIDLLAEAVVPQPQHHVDHQLPHHLFPQDDGPGHAHVMVGMAAIVQRRQGQVDRDPALGREAPDPLADHAHVQGVRRAHHVLAVVLGAAHRDQDDVVLAPVGLHLVADGGLDVGAGLGPLAAGGGEAVLLEPGVDLGVGGLPDLLLQAADGVVFKEQVGLLRGEEPLGCLRAHAIVLLPGPPQADATGRLRWLGAVTKYLVHFL